MPLAQQDRSRWDTRLIAEGVTVLQAALARDRLGEYQAHAAIAALHADARTVEETDWVQVVEWYDELVRPTGSPVATRLNRAVAAGEADGPRAGWPPRPSSTLAPPPHRRRRGVLHERSGDPGTAVQLSRQAARLNAELLAVTSKSLEPGPPPHPSRGSASRADDGRASR